MTVGELILQLDKYDSNLPIMLITQDAGHEVDIRAVCEVFPVDENARQLVVPEGKC